MHIHGIAIFEFLKIRFFRIFIVLQKFGDL